VFTGPTGPAPEFQPPRFRVLDPRWLAGHPLGGPLRPRLHAFRWPRGVHARRDADRDQRVGTPPRLRRGTLARPCVPRFARITPDHHRSASSIPQVSSTRAWSR